MGVLSDHLEHVRSTLLAKAEEVGIAEHGTVVGTARELVVSEFLGRSLPRSFDFVSGEIADASGARSGQLDVMALPHYSPQLRLTDGISLGLAHAVAAVIEVKSTLTTAPIKQPSELRSALETTKKVRDLSLEGLEPWPWTASMEGRNVTLPHIPVAVISFWGPTLPTLVEKLDEWAALHGHETLPNVIACLDRNYTLVRNDEWMFVRSRLPVESQSCRYVYGEDPGAAMVDLFVFLMKVLQAWDYKRPRTPLNRY